ncbi:hypothetical protein Tco_0111121 [Tanacetum coccineum]
MTTLAENVIVAGADNHPPMLEKSMYNSWQSRMILYIKGNEHGRMILDPVLNEPLVYGTIEVDSLPQDMYSLVNHHDVAKDIWDRVRLLMQGTELSQQERECKVYNEFDMFTSIKGESIHKYYLRFSQLINDMHTIRMTMQPVQVNTKFLNSLQPEWSKFVTDVKLAKNMHMSNYDRLYAYLSQHDAHANEVCLMRERFLDPIALQQYQALISHSTPSVPQHAYQALGISQQSQVEFPHLDSSLTVPLFLPGDNPIASLNKEIAFLSITIALRYPTTNNQSQSFAGEGHMARQCTQPKWPKNSKWFKEKILLVQAQESGQTYDLDAFDSDCDEAPSAKAVLMNLYSYDLDVISEVPISDTYQDNYVLNHCVQEMDYFEQPAFNPTSDIEITSDSIIDEISSQVAKCNENKNVNESLTAELERYKERQTKEKEDKYIEEIVDLEKKKKELDNIVYKVGQSVQTMHMLTEHQVFYDDNHKTALGYQNLFYLKKAQRIKPMLYDGSVLTKKHDVISMVDYEETLIYAKLNKLSEQIEKHFVPQKELSAEQAFWLPISNPIFEQLVVPPTPVKMEVPRELPTVSLVKKSFQKLISHLANFDKVVKVRTTASAIIVATVEKCSVDKKSFEIQKKELLLENDRLLELIISQDLVHTAVNLLAAIVDYQIMEKSYTEEYNRNQTLAAKLSKMNELSKTCLRLENRCICLELKLQQNKESFQNNRYCNNPDAPAFKELFIINDLKAQLQANESSISKLRAHIATLKCKSMSDNNVSINNANLIAPEMFRIVEQARALNPIDAHLDYACKFTTRIQDLLVYVNETCPSSQVESKKLVAVTPKNIIRQVRFLEPKQSTSNTPTLADSQTSKITNKPLLTSTGMKSSTSASGSQPSGNTKKNKISRTTSSNQKNKVEGHLRSVKSSLNKKNRVSECIASTKQNVLKANSKSVCKTCNECLFNACHDACVVDYLNNMNKCAKSRSAKSNKKKDWKPTGKVFTSVGYRLLPIGRTFTIDGTKCPMTRITSTKVVPPKETSQTPYLDSGCSKRMTGQRSQLINFVDKFLGTVKFGNDQVVGIEDSHHGPSDAVHHPPKLLKLLSKENIRVILFSIHSDDGNPSSASIKQALRRSDNENKQVAVNLMQSMLEDPILLAENPVKEVNALDFHNKCWQKDFKDYTGCEPKTYRHNLLRYLEELDKLIDERVLKYGELQMKEREVQAINKIEKCLKETEIQQQESLSTDDTTLDASLVIESAALEASLVTEGIALDDSLVTMHSTVDSRTSSEHHNECNSSRNECSRSGIENRSSDNESSSSGNDTNADIGPLYDTDTVFEVHHDIFENMFVHEIRNHKQHESIQDTYVVNENKSNIISDIPNMDPDRDKEEHDYVDYEQHRAFFASLINNLKCEVEKCNMVNCEAQQANALLTNELERYKEKEKHFAKDKTIESE